MINDFEKQLKILEYQYTASLIEPYNLNMKGMDLYGYEDIKEMIKGTINKFMSLNVTSREQWDKNYKSYLEFHKVCKENAKTISKNDYDLFLYLEGNPTKQFRGDSEKHLLNEKQKCKETFTSYVETSSLDIKKVTYKCGSSRYSDGSIAYCSDLCEKIY